jgi:hypothetical protein
MEQRRKRKNHEALRLNASIAAAGSRRNGRAYREKKGKWNPLLTQTCEEWKERSATAVAWRFPSSSEGVLRHARRGRRRCWPLRMERCLLGISMNRNTISGLQKFVQIFILMMVISHFCV